ncbi:MAG: glycosyltransferase family 2 protein [Planctomycetota bacterium]|nr:glycosyltransferase family 2 protein [Planctomycetota bacterium]
MLVIHVLLAVYAAIAMAYWGYTLWAARACIRTVPPLAPPVEPPAAWPKVSVIVAACNEADTIEPAARALLAQNYADLEIVLVDDRSTDGTGAIIDRLAGEDGRVRPVHVTQLPEGWLGKVHALDAGLAVARGEWLLFTDADVHLRPDTLGKAVAHCLARRADHLALLPVVPPVGLAVEALIAVFVRHFLCFLVRPWTLGRPGAGTFVGIGAFNLVRRRALDATEGFAWLRLEVADDMGLGLMLQRSGARSELASGFQDVSVRWYTSVAGAIRGSEKAVATLSRFRLLRTLAACAAMLAMEMSPLLLPIPLCWPATRAIGWAGAGVAAVALAAVLVLARWGRGRILPALLAPAIAPLMAWAMLRALLLGRRRGGVLWRGVLYPKQALLDHMRVKF